MKKKYWVRPRQIATVVWLIILFLVPFGGEKLGGASSGFISFFLCLALGLPLFFWRMSTLVGTGITLLLAVIGLYSSNCCRVVQTLEHRLQDAFFQLRGPIKPSGEVVIVDIDQKSLEEFGQWPWPRTQLAKAVRQIDADGARAIGFDIVFPEPDRLSLKDWVGRLASMGGEVSHNFKVDQATVNEIVLKDWKRRLEKTESSFQKRGSWSQEEIIEGYLAFAKKWWDDEEQTTLKRMQRAGLEYLPRPFIPSKDPLQAMQRASRELFYINQQSQVAVADNDVCFAKAIYDTGAVMGGLFILESTAGAKMTPFRKYESLTETPSMVVSRSIIDAEVFFPHLRQAQRQVVNVPAIQSRCQYQGMFNLIPDESGAARYYTVLMRAPVYQVSLVPQGDLQGEALLNPKNYDSKIVSQVFTYPSLGLEVFRKAYGYETVQPEVHRSVSGLRLTDGERKNRFLPLNKKGDIPINYLGYGGKWQPECRHSPDYYFTYISLSDVVKGAFATGTFNGKSVLIGSSDPTLSDLVGSPFNPAFPGLEVHATFLDNLITNNLLFDYGKRGETTTYLGVLAGGLALTAAMTAAPVWLGVAMATLVLAVVPSLGFLLFLQSGFFVPIVFLWFSLFVVGATVMLVNFFVEGKEARFVTRQFSAMVSPKVLEKLKSDPKSVSLGGQRSKVTVMFSDVEAFTTISEALNPKELVEVLNDYLTPMTDIILRHDGFVDKFIGDAIMSVWGVPFPDEVHAIKGCRAAVEQQKALAVVAKKIKEDYGVDIAVRTALASGEVSAAMMGSEERKSYTIMGDAVNIGARLEPICNDYGVKVIICQETQAQIKDHFSTRLLDKIIVKGKTKPIKIYELIVDDSESVLYVAQKYTQALEKYWDRQWTEALELIEPILSLDKAARHLKGRIEVCREDPPPSDWDGSYTRLHK